MNEKSLALYLHVYIQSDRKCVSYWRTIVSGASPAPLCLSQNRFNKGEHRDPRIYDIITYPRHYLAFFLNQGRLKLMFAFFFLKISVGGMQGSNGKGGLHLSDLLNSDCTFPSSSGRCLTPLMRRWLNTIKGVMFLLLNTTSIKHLEVLPGGVHVSYLFTKVHANISNARLTFMVTVVTGN